MKNTKFIILNLLATILEISFIIFSIYHFVIADSIILGYILLGIYSIFLVLMIVLSFGNHKVFHTIGFPEDMKQTIDQMHGVFKERFPNTHIEFCYVEDDQFIEPAAYLNKKIYVNSKYKFSAIFFEAILAHELGHAQSKLITLRIVHLLRISSAVSRLIYSFRVKNQAFFKRKYSLILDGIVFVIYNVFNIFDHFVSNPFFRRDEVRANSIAIELGYGEALRYFYYFNYIHASKEGLLVRKYYDYKHPSTKQMLDLMELEMHLDPAEIDVFAVHNKIQEVKNTKGLKEKNTKILQWYQYKASSNNPLFQYELGLVYLKGRYGLIADVERAMKYFELAKAQGFVAAYYQLGLIYYKQTGADKEAFEHFKFAATNEYKLAYKYYANCLSYGVGTDIDSEQATEWYELAASNGDKEAINYLSLIGYTFSYESHTNKNTVVEEDSYVCQSVNKIERILGEKTVQLHAKFQHQSILLFTDDGREFGRFAFRGDKLIRKNVVIHESEEVVHNTMIVYSRKTEKK